MRFNGWLGLALIVYIGRSRLLTLRESVSEQIVNYELANIENKENQRGSALVSTPTKWTRIN